MNKNKMTRKICTQCQCEYRIPIHWKHKPDICFKCKLLNTNLESILKSYIENRKHITCANVSPEEKDYIKNDVNTRNELEKIISESKDKTTLVCQILKDKEVTCLVTKIIKNYNYNKKTKYKSKNTPTEYKNSKIYQGGAPGLGKHS